MSDFEGFDGQTAEQPSKNVFWARKGVNETAVSTDSQLPPGATKTPDFTKRTSTVTTSTFLKEVGG